MVGNSANAFRLKLLFEAPHMATVPELRAEIAHLQTLLATQTDEQIRSAMLERPIRRVEAMAIDDATHPSHHR